MDKSSNEFEQNLKHLREILEQEFSCMRQMLDLEQLKRSAILGIQANKIQQNCKAQEKWHNNLYSLESRKEKLLKSLLPGQDLNLSNLLALCEKKSGSGHAWNDFISKYRQLALSLQKAVAENETLLHDTNTSIQRIIQDASQSMSSAMAVAYTPAGKPRTKSSSSVFLNANA